MSAPLDEAVQAALDYFRDNSGWLLLADDVGAPAELLDLLQPALTYTGG